MILCESALYLPTKNDAFDHKIFPLCPFNMNPIKT